MKKRMLSILLMLVLCVGLLSVTALADGEPAVVAQGNCGADGNEANVTWTLNNDGLLTISGTGAMTEWDQPWENYANQIKSAVIEEGVTNIGAYMLANTTMESVSIPSTVTFIDDYAFGRSALKEVTLPATVKSVGGSLFSTCLSLKKATINCNIAGKGTFNDCKALESVTFGENVTRIGMNSFAGCTALKNIVLPEGLTTLDAAAFQGSGITAITIPAGITTIQTRTFSGCGALATVTFSEGLETIEQEAFKDCIALTKLVFPSTLTAINRNYAFQNCVGLKEIVFSKNLTLIGNYSFDGCSDLETVTLYDKLTTVADNAFSGCAKLATVNFHGTEEQWAAIDFTTGNEPLTAATINIITFADEVPVVKAANDPKTGKITLTIEEVYGATGYKIFVSDKKDGDYKLAAETTELTYTHGGKVGTKYYFKVQAVNEAGETSAESAAVNKFRVPAQVTSLKATSKSKQVTLKWKKVSGAKKYEIYMSKNGKTGWKKVGTATTNKFVYKKGKVGAKLYFKVRAITANGKKGEYSKVVSVKVKK